MKFLEAKALRLAAENKALAGAPENKGVAFASAAARIKAQELGLTAEQLAQHAPSGATGFTVADVEQLARPKDEDGEGDAQDSGPGDEA